MLSVFIGKRLKYLWSVAVTNLGNFQKKQDIREVSQNPVAIAKMKQDLTNHLGLLYVAFWTRLAVAVAELWYASRLLGRFEEQCAAALSLCSLYTQFPDATFE
eukprot:2328408-Amphidinium_carterae.3